MSVFTKEKKDLSRCRTVFVKLDSKGRISIPSFLRKNLDVKTGDSLELVFDLSKNFFIVQNAPPFLRKKSGKVSQKNYDTNLIVQNGVEDRIEDCESFGAGSIPASGPQKSKRRNKYGRG